MTMRKFPTRAPSNRAGYLTPSSKPVANRQGLGPASSRGGKSRTIADERTRRLKLWYARRPELARAILIKCRARRRHAHMIRVTEPHRTQELLHFDGFARRAR